MTLTRKILWVNVIILFAYLTLLNMALKAEGNKAGLGFLILAAFSLGLHLVINLIIAIIMFCRGKEDIGRAFLFTLPLILVIGFPMCFAGVGLLDNIH